LIYTYFEWWSWSSQLQENSDHTQLFASQRHSFRNCWYTHQHYLCLSTKVSFLQSCLSRWYALEQRSLAWWSEPVKLGSKVWIYQIDWFFWEYLYCFQQEGYFAILCWDFQERLVLILNPKFFRLCAYSRNVLLFSVLDHESGSSY